MAWNLHKSKKRKKTGKRLLKKQIKSVSKDRQMPKSYRTKKTGENNKGEKKRRKKEELR
jgi:hypothetical protein